MSRALTVSEIETEIGPLVQRAAARAPAKVIARQTGLTERHIRGLRQGEHRPGGAAPLALAAVCPNLKAAVARWLALEPLDPATEALVEQVRRYAAAQAEEGDRERPE